MIASPLVSNFIVRSHSDMRINYGWYINVVMKYGLLFDQLFSREFYNHGIFIKKGKLLFKMNVLQKYTKCTTKYIPNKLGRYRKEWIFKK